MVAHAYNPSYLGGRYQEDHSSRPGRAESLWNLISTNKLDVVEVEHIYNTNYVGGVNKKIIVQTARTKT
jgi:hypothetical protein